MNINAIFPAFKAKAKKDSLNIKKYYGNLAPLKADTVSFKGNSKLEEAHIHLDWIESGKVKKLVKSILEDPNRKPITSSEFQSIIKYFGYFKNGNNGHGDTYDLFGYPDAGPRSHFTVEPEVVQVDLAVMEHLREALAIVDDMNGELISPPDNKHTLTEEDKEGFKKGTSEFRPESHNKYRKYWQEAHDKALEEEENLRKTQELKQEAEAKKTSDIKTTRQKQDDIVIFGDKLQSIAHVRSSIEKAKEMEKMKSDNIESLIEGFKDAEEMLKAYYTIYKHEINPLRKDVAEFCETSKNDKEFKKEIRKFNHIEKELKSYESDDDIASEYSTEKLEELEAYAESTLNNIKKQYDDFNEKYQELAERILNLMSLTDSDGTNSDRIAKFKERLAKQQEQNEEISKEPTREDLIMQRVARLQKLMPGLRESTLDILEIFELEIEMLEGLGLYPEKLEEIKKQRDDLHEFYLSYLAQDKLNAFKEKFENDKKFLADSSSPENDIEKILQSQYINEVLVNIPRIKSKLVEYNDIIYARLGSINSTASAQEADEIISENKAAQAVSSTESLEDIKDNENNRKNKVAAIEAIIKDYNSLDKNIGLIISKYDILSKINNEVSRKREIKRAIKEIGEGIISPLRQERAKGYGGISSQISKISENIHNEEIALPELIEYEKATQTCLNNLVNLVSSDSMMSFTELVDKINELEKKVIENDVASVEASKPAKKERKTSVKEKSKEEQPKADKPVKMRKVSAPEEKPTMLFFRLYNEKREAIQRLKWHISQTNHIVCVKAQKGETRPLPLFIDKVVSLEEELNDIYKEGREFHHMRKGQEAYEETMQSYADKINALSDIDDLKREFDSIIKQGGLTDEAKNEVKPVQQEEIDNAVADLINEYVDSAAQKEPVSKAEPLKAEEKAEEAIPEVKEESPVEEIYEPQPTETLKEEDTKIVKIIARNITTLRQINVFFDDMRYEVRKVFADEDFEKLQNASSEAYNEIIQSKIEQLSKSNSIKQLKRAQMFAIMSEIVAEKKMEPEKLYTSSLSQINRWINTLSELPQGGAEKLSFFGITSNYKENKGYLNQDEAKQIAKLFVNCFGSMPSSDYNNLLVLLATEGRYFNKLTNNNANQHLKYMLLKMLASDMDNSFGTNYLSKTDSAISNLKKANILNNKEMYKSLRNIW